MRKVRGWLLGAVLGAILAAGGMWLMTTSSADAALEAIMKDHWRHHDGHWTYWHNADKRWYYTDGSHWFYHHDGAWKLYEFDKDFGLGCERGEYKVTERERLKIVVPTHKVYVP